MWTLLSRRVQLWVIVAIAATIIYAGQSFYEWSVGRHVSPLQLVSVVATVIGTGVVIVFNASWRWLWRKFPVLQKSIFPDLNGTWRGILQSTWKDPATGLSPGPIDVVIWIKQDLFDFSVTQQTKESQSWSTRMFARADRTSDRYGLWFSYDNKPHANVGFRSSDHEGVASLVMNLEQDRLALTGQYYTARSTSGNIQVRRIASTQLLPSDARSWKRAATTHFD